MSLTLLIEFAAAKGLAVTLRNDDGTRFISKATRQTPTAYLSHHRTYSWSNKDEFIHAVVKRLDAKSVFKHSTEVNPNGPAPGDLMSSADHTALVFKVYPPGQEHARASDPRIPIFPGPQVTAKQLTQTEYFRADHSDIKPTVHFDYLNRFQFRRYSSAVLDNWVDWDGIGDPPR